MFVLRANNTMMELWLRESSYIMSPGSELTEDLNTVGYVIVPRACGLCACDSNLGVFTLSFFLVALYIANTVTAENTHQTATILQKPSLQLVTMGISHKPTSVTSCIDRVH